MKKQLRFIGLFASALLLYTPGIHAQVLVRGTVVGLNGTLQGATISTGKITTITSEQGTFSLEMIPGKHILSITHVGYQSLSARVTVDSSGNTFYFIMKAASQMEELIVVGSRVNRQRSNLMTPVPVDVISSGQLSQTNQANLVQMMNFSVPSFNASRSLVNEPVSLRGLDPDQVLILVNGKRYHNMAFLNWGGVRGILGRGAVSNDLNSIPFSSIEKIEVLRDGASAQYGSDAIAGVINIRLKTLTGKTESRVHAGQHYIGDGESFTAGVHHGITLAKKGFLNFSGDCRLQNPTRRGGTYQGTVYSNNVPVDDSIVKARNFDRNKVSNAGTSEHRGYAFAFNGGYSASNNVSFGLTAIFNDRTTEFVSGYTLPKNESRINPAIFPDGFQSKPTNHTRDVILQGNIDGKLKNSWDWSLGSTYGWNNGDYYNKETNNASQYYTLGKNAPTTFYTGSLGFSQFTNTIQFSNHIVTTKSKDIHIALGAEWRVENYNITSGEEASWKTYGTNGQKQGGSGGLVLSPTDAAHASRNVGALYAESNVISGKFLIDLASRYEYYEGFGGNLAGKIAMRYRVGRNFAIRNSISNGFRAPSLQQIFYSHTRLMPVSQNGTYSFVTNGIFRNSSEVAMALGIPALKPETAINIGYGFTNSFGPSIRLTVDGYWIQIRNRIALSGTFSKKTNEAVRNLLANITDVEQVQFFVNAISTRTNGVDFVLNGNWKIKKSKLNAILAANFTQTRIYGEIEKAGNLKMDSLNSNTLFSFEEKTKLEKGQPSNKIILTLSYHTGRAKFQLQNTRFGKTGNAAPFTDPVTRSTKFLYQDFSPKVLTDVSFSYSFRQWFAVSVGANNVFNIYPERLNDYRNTGEGIYRYSMEASSFCFNGGYYFVTMQVNICNNIK